MIDSLKYKTKVKFGELIDLFTNFNNLKVKM